MEYPIAQSILAVIMNDSYHRDQDYVELRDDLLSYAYKYARLRADWQLADTKGCIAMDDHRKSTHDALIDACNILSRYMHGKGYDARWREELGQERKQLEIGPAMFIVLWV